MGLSIFALAKQKRSVRLGVRTPGFHPGSRGSIPLRTTEKHCTKLVINKLRAFFMSYGQYCGQKYTTFSILSDLYLSFPDFFI